MSAFEIFLWGMTASLAAGLATGAGALPVLLFKTISKRMLNIMLGFAAGEGSGGLRVWVYHLRANKWEALPPVHPARTP